MGELFLGVDVGTGSARAGLFDGTGRLVGVSKQSIRVWHEPGGIVEQSSSDIWWACGEAIRGALASANARAADVVGVGFDATCSLVVVDPEGRPVAAGPSGDDMRNVIVWMDHRATAEADLINAGHHEVLNYVGGRISPEMQPPKLLWLKRNIPKAFRRAGHFFDLSDFLTWKATGSTTRSICTVTCKWSYLAHERRWDAEFFTAIGLEDFPQEGFRQIGQTMALPGSAIGGISEQAALELGLLPGTPVGCSLIDAHAGAIGTIGSRDAEGGIPDPTERLALIMGTSACIMATTRQACFVPGLWGPYFEALLPGFWLNEGGQSAWGAAIDYLMRHHASWGEVCQAATAEGLDPLDPWNAGSSSTGPAFRRWPIRRETFTFSPIFLATARRLQTRMCEGRFSASTWTAISQAWSAFTSPGSADWATRPPKSSRRSRQRALPPIRWSSAAVPPAPPLCARSSPIRPA